MSFEAKKLAQFQVSLQPEAKCNRAAMRSHGIEPHLLQNPAINQFFLRMESLSKLQARHHPRLSLNDNNDLLVLPGQLGQARLIESISPAFKACHCGPSFRSHQYSTSRFISSDSFLPSLSAFTLTFSIRRTWHILSRR